MSLSAYEVIQRLRDQSGRLAKETILKSQEFNDEFKMVLYATYEPTLNYYIKKLPPVKEPTVAMNSLTYVVNTMIEQLSTRKVRGSAAKDLLRDLSSTLSPENREVLALILNGDLKCGISDKTILSVFPNMISYFPYMRCSTNGDVPYPALSEEKADGIFCRAKVSLNLDLSFSVYVSSRQGKPLTDLPEGLIQSLEELGEGIYEGEMLIKKAGKVLPREVGNGIINASFIKATKALPKGHSCSVVLWDTLPIEDFNKKICRISREGRLKNLESKVEKTTNKDFISVIDYRFVNSYAEAQEHYKELLSQGKEGTVLKDVRAIWKDGTSKQQIKMKQKVVVELLCVDFLDAADGSKNEGTFGSILCRSQCGKLEVAVTGIPDKEREEIHKNREYYKGKPLSVESNGIMYSKDLSKKLHSLFLPTFQGFRDQEKTEADTFEYIEEAFKV